MNECSSFLNGESILKTLKRIALFLSLFLDNFHLEDLAGGAKGEDADRHGLHHIRTAEAIGCAASTQ